jgi:hypothetical protein
MEKRNDFVGASGFSTVGIREILKNDGSMKNADGSALSVLDIDPDYLDELIEGGLFTVEDIRGLAEMMGGLKERETVNQFNRLINEVFEYEEMHRNKIIPERLKSAARNILSHKSPRRALLIFLSAGKMDGVDLKEYKSDIARIMKVYLAFFHAEKSGLFRDLEAKEETLKKEFSSLFESFIAESSSNDDDSKYTAVFYDEDSNKIEVEVLIRKKEAWRVIDKLLRKSGDAFSDIHDLFGGRVLTKNLTDRDKFVAFFKTKPDQKDQDEFKAKPDFIQKYHLFFDDEDDSNVTADPDRREIKGTSVSWDKAQKHEESKSRTEFQIMSRSDYIKSEMGAKNHLFYNGVLQACLRNDRVDGGVPKSEVEMMIESVLPKIPRRKGQSLGQLRDELYERFSHYFFCFEGFFYAYDHIFRVRHKAPRKNFQRIFQAATQKLNDASGLEFNHEQWCDFLDRPEDLFSSRLNGKSKSYRILELKKIDHQISGLPGPFAKQIRKRVKIYDEGRQANHNRGSQKR